MVRIEQLSSAPDRAGRYRVTFSDGTTLRLYRQTVEDFSLYAGMDMDEKDYSKLCNAAGEMSAKMRAVRIVSASNVSRSELRHRLIQKGEDAVQAENAVKWMSELSLIDDTKTAEHIVQRCIAKGYGLARAKQMLYEKRIPKDIWESVLADYPDQEDAVVDFLRQKLGDDRDEKACKRAIDAAIRRGHSYSTIRRALRKLNADIYPED